MDISAAGILAGTIIGAGMFALPFIAAEAGILWTLFIGGVCIASFVVLHRMYADIVVWGGEPKFALYAEEFLGRWAFWPAIFAVALGMLFVLAIYLVLSASFAALIAPTFYGIFPLLFWFGATLSMVLPLRLLARLETGGTVLMCIIAAVVFLYGLGNIADINPSFSPRQFNVNTLLLPFGPLLFAFAGRTAIPSVVRSMRGRSRGFLKKTILLGTIIPAIVYALFILGVWGLSNGITIDAVSGMVKAPPELLIALGILGLLALFTSYVVVAISVRDVLEKDLGYSWIVGTGIVTIFPLAMYEANIASFLTLVSFVGGTFLVIESLLVLWMWRGARLLGRLPLRPKSAAPYLIWPITLLFCAVFVYEVWRFF